MKEPPNLAPLKLFNLSKSLDTLQRNLISCDCIRDLVLTVKAIQLVTIQVGEGGSVD